MLLNLVIYTGRRKFHSGIQPIMQVIKVVKIATAVKIASYLHRSKKVWSMLTEV